MDQQLTALSTQLIHDELDIPQAPANTPYGLQILLDMFRAQYINMIKQIKSPSYKVTVESLIKQEKVRREKLKCHNFFLYIYKILLGAKSTFAESCRTVRKANKSVN